MKIRNTSVKYMTMLKMGESISEYYVNTCRIFMIFVTFL